MSGMSRHQFDQAKAIITYAVQQEVAREAAEARAERVENMARDANSAVIQHWDRADASEAEVVHALSERDEAIELLDRLAYTVGTVADIGEHTSLNDPIQNAIRLAAETREYAEQAQAKLEQVRDRIENPPKGRPFHWIAADLLEILDSQSPVEQETDE